MSFQSTIIKSLSSKKVYSNFKWFLIIGFLFSISIQNLQAQKLKTPTAYLNYIGDQYAALSKEYYQYLSAIAHSDNIEKVEKKRQDLLSTSWKVTNVVRTMPSFNGDRSLRDSAAAYLNLNHRILKEDYDLILNMSKIAENSYSEMEAFLLAQEQSAAKLDRANSQMVIAQRTFATKYGVELYERNDITYDKMLTTNEVIKYYNDLYLIFFKCHKEDYFLQGAVLRNNVEEMKLHMNQLNEYAESGLMRLKSFDAYEGDISLLSATKKILTFYEQISKNEMSEVLAFEQIKQEYEAAKATFESTPESKKTPEDFTYYNYTVRNYNLQANKYNAVNNYLYTERSNQVTYWNHVFKTFIDNHIPNF